ncbi:hypothetical protein A0202_23355, partial [Salmonella enterica]|nr:hypothetical protein [Salmonella enterica]
IYWLIYTRIIGEGYFCRRMQTGIRQEKGQESKRLKAKRSELAQFSDVDSSLKPQIITAVII